MNRNPGLPANMSAALAAAAAQARNAPPINLAVIPRYDLRKLIADAVAQCSQIRGQLVATAAQLHRIASEVEGSLHVIRAQALGKLPDGIDARMIPTEGDIRDLRQLADAIAELADESVTVATVDPFDDGSKPRFGNADPGNSDG